CLARTEISGNMITVVIRQPAQRAAGRLGKLADTTADSSRKGAGKDLDGPWDGATEFFDEAVERLAAIGDKFLEPVGIAVPLAMKVARRKPVRRDYSTVVLHPHRCE